MASLKSVHLKSLPSSVFYIIGIFLIWRILLFLFAFYAVSFVPLGSKDMFLGGGERNYSAAPLLYGWANFDGEHYLSIAQYGYKNLEHAFFPFYPLLMSILAGPFFQGPDFQLFHLTIAGLVISNTTFLLALAFLWKLVREEFSSKIAYWTLVAVLVFPTSFYFGALYNESLFLLLSVSSFYFAKRNKWFLAGLTGGLSSSVRIFGVLILPALLANLIRSKRLVRRHLWLLLVPGGFLLFVAYQWISVGNPLAFYFSQKMVGAQRTSYFVLLPQILYRYTKILESIDLRNPIYQTVVLELISGLLFFLLPIYGFFKKVSLGYVIYCLGGFLVSTIQGSFSSVPRYLLVFFPCFIVIAIIVSRFSKMTQLIYFLVSIFLLAVESMLFFRGYWVA